MSTVYVFKPESLPALKGSDSDDPFTSTSIHCRLPDIVLETMRRNEDSISSETAAALKKIAQDLQSGNPLVPLRDDPHQMYWGTLKYTDLPVDEVPWFYLENYIYRRILSHFPLGVDPFRHQKVEALEGARGQAFACTAATTVGSALMLSLWGNRADLSLSAGKKVSAAELLEGGLLTDATDQILSALRDTARLKKRVYLFVDNCGLELLRDLSLSAVVLRGSPAEGIEPVQGVTIMCKASPVFVSDATGKDVIEHIDWLCEAVEELGSSLRAELQSGRIKIQEHEFLCSGEAFWDMPRGLSEELACACGLAIVKGDANYRRLLGDRHWRHTTPFPEALSYFPCPVAALRTLKAGIVVGLGPDVNETTLPKNWLVSGQYGVIQCKP